MKNNACLASFYCLTSLILSESLSGCQNNKQTRKINVSLSSSPCRNKDSQCCLLFFLSPAGVICACEYQNSWLFSFLRQGRIFTLFTWRARWVPVSAFWASWGFSSDSVLMASSHAGGGREANPGWTTWNINALCRTASSFLEAALEKDSHCHSILRVIKGLTLDVWRQFRSRWIKASGWRSRCEVAADGQESRSDLLPTITDLSVWQCCRQGLWPPIWEAQGPGASLSYLFIYFYTSPLRLPHTLIPARAERGCCSLNQQPGRKCEERRAGLHNWLWIEAEDSVGGGVSDRSVSLHSTPDKQWQTWITQLPLSLMML